MNNGFYSPRYGTGRRYMTYGLAGAMDADGNGLKVADDEYVPSYAMGPASANPANPQGQGGFFDSMALVPDYLQKILSVKQTWDMTEINKDLIRQGKPPLSTAQIQALSPRAYVGIAPDTQQLLIYGGIGIAAVLLLTSFAKRR